MTDDLYALRGDMKPVNLVWRVSETPDLDTGLYTTVYDSTPLKALVLPLALSIREGQQRVSAAIIKMGGSYYDQQRRVFVFDMPHPRMVARNWLIHEGLRYDIEDVDHGPGNVIRITGRQETEVVPVNYITESIRTTLYTGEMLDDQS